MSKPFAFHLGTPLLKGNLLKQGGFGKLFKKRYFVLYPGFLVYYSDLLAWKSDVARGDTLGNRIGAVYLKGAICKIADYAPKGCRFGFLVQASDPRNKRQSFLLNASDKAERDAWIEAIVQATPQKKEKETAAVPPLSTSVPTVRRDAVDVAAVVGVGNSHDEDEETVTNMDASILPSAEEMAGVDQIANQFLKPQSNATNYDSDGESPAPEDLVYAEEQAVMVFGDDGDGDDDDDSGDGDDGDAIEIVVQRVVQIGCETAVEPLETEKRTFEPSEVSWCSADGCNLTQDKGITYSINVASTYGCSSSHNSDTSDSCGEDDETKVQETDSKRHEGSKESDDDKGSKETKTNSPLDENQRGIEQAGTLLESPKNDAGTTFIEKRGLIYKLGGKRKNWKLRYFALYPGYFCYYKDHSVPKPIGKVKLKNVTVTESDPTSKGKQPFQFTVHTESAWNNRCDWVLAAFKADELQDWVTAFRLAGQRR